MPPTVDAIKPGSICLYDTPGDLVDTIIEKVSIGAAHVEWFEGNGQSLASRNGIGVGRYPFRTEGLIAVLEPDSGLNSLDDCVKEFTAWFETVNGEGYDWQGLEGFLTDKVTQQPLHWFCSAFVAKGIDRAGFPLFNKLWNPSLITPSDFLKTPMLKWTWADVTKIYQVTE